MVYTTISFVCYFLGNKDSSNSCSYNLNLSTFSCFYFSFVYLTSRPKQITIVLTKLLLHLSEENLLISELGGHTRQHLQKYYTTKLTQCPLFSISIGPTYLTRSKLFSFCRSIHPFFFILRLNRTNIKY